MWKSWDFLLDNWLGLAYSKGVAKRTTFTATRIGLIDMNIEIVSYWWQQHTSVWARGYKVGRFRLAWTDSEWPVWRLMELLVYDLLGNWGENDRIKHSNVADSKAVELGVPCIGRVRPNTRVGLRQVNVLWPNTKGLTLPLAMDWLKDLFYTNTNRAY